MVKKDNDIGEFVEPLNLIDFKNAFEDIEDQKRLMDIWDYLVYNRHILTIKDEE